MKYIQKTTEPDFFVHDKQRLQLLVVSLSDKSIVWNKYKPKKKRKLKEHILNNEQYNLCCYCERRVTVDTSHIEHIEPKSNDYERLTFEYTNLAVSCDGECDTQNDRTRYNCGHKKDNEYDSIMFLDPTKVQDIRDYFKYNYNGEIQATNKDKTKAEYTIKILNLNPDNNHLQEARKKAYKVFLEDSDDDEIDFLLEDESTPFLSFIKYQYNYITKA